MVDFSGFQPALDQPPVAPTRPVTLALALAVQLLVPRLFAVAPQSLLGWGMMLGAWGLGLMVGFGTAVKGEE